ncbi:MAG: PAS domain S-box protein [Pseudomonadota bacterium]
MSHDLPYLPVILFFPAILSGFLLYYSARIYWTKRRKTAELLMSLIAAGSFLTTVSYSLSPWVHGLNGKMAIAFFFYVGGLGHVLATFLFSLWYVGKWRWIATPGRLVLLFLPTAVGLTALATNSVHAWYYAEASVIYKHGIALLRHTPGPLYYPTQAYAFIVSLFSLGFIIHWRLSSPRGYYRNINLLLFGVSAPLWGQFLYLLGVRPWGFLNLMPIFLTLNSVALTICVFRMDVLGFAPLMTALTLRELPLGIVVLNEDLRILDINKAAEGFLSVSSAKVLNRVIGEALPENDPLAAFAGKPGLASLIIQRGDRRLQLTKAVVTGHYEEAAGFILSIQDETERTLAEEALRASEERFRSFVENANDIVYSLSLEGSFSYVSPNWTEILGHDVDELVGKYFGLFVHPDDLGTCLAFLELITRTKGKQGGVEYRVMKKSGEWSWHTSNVSPVLDKSGNIAYYIGIARDITRRKEMEIEREHLIGELERSLSEIKTLQGFIPICANCKKIRTDEGYWEQIEKYISDRTDARFSHGICQECARKLYPELYEGRDGPA